MKKPVCIITILCMTFVGFGIVFLAYVWKEQTISQKLLLAFEQAVEMDRDKRFKECNIPYIFRFDPNEQTDQITLYDDSTHIIIDKGEELQSQSSIVKINNAHQTYLFKRNPIRVAVLDSLWRVELSKQGLLLPTLVAYTNVNTGETNVSRPDILLFASANATDKKVIGVLGEITLQGFAKITPLFVVKQSAALFILLISGWILACLLSLFIAYHITRNAKTPESLKPLEEDSTNIIQWDPVGKYIIYNDIKIGLSSKVKLGQCFHLLWEYRETIVSYEILIDALYGKIEKEGGKVRLTQTISNLREIIQPIPIMEIGNIANCGYKLMLHPSKEK
jgi:hypothetical protein